MNKKNENVRITFQQLEEKQLNKHSEKLSSALRVGVVVGVMGIGYKLARTVINIKKKK